MIFSRIPFPEHDVKIDYVGKESGGSLYHNEKYNQDLWLCPALFKYFKKAPKEIYIKIKVY
jgi:DNA-binding XRE family transcriptional regulator